MTLAPLQLSPIFMPRIWGSRDLRPLFNAETFEEKPDAAASQKAACGPIGEVWLTGEDCRVASGSFAGRTLREVWPELPQEFTGSRAFGSPRIPLLVKFIFPEDKLSVQVHPNDEYALEHEAAAGGMGKTEMWYAVSARAGAELRLGLEPGVTQEKFRQAIADGSAEQSMRRFAVEAGDAFFVPAGAAHMIGPGMVLCEVQQHSDLTYRVFDYNRVQADGKPRQLHLRQAMDVMNFGEQAGGLAEPVRLRRGALLAKYLVACPHFAVERWEFSQPIAAATSAGSFELLIVLTGKGRIEWGSEGISYGPAQLFMLPASLGSYRILPESGSESARASNAELVSQSPSESKTVLLRSYVPDLGDLVQFLAGQGIEEAAWSRIVHL